MNQAFTTKESINTKTITMQAFLNEQCSAKMEPNAFLQSIVVCQLVQTDMGPNFFLLLSFSILECHFTSCSSQLIDKVEFMDP